VVLIFGTLFGQGRLLEPFDLVEVLREAVLPVLLVQLPLHFNLTESAISVSFSSPVLVADTADARRHESQESGSNNGIAFATPARAAPCAVVARPRSARVPRPAAAAATASASA